MVNEKLISFDGRSAFRRVEKGKIDDTYILKLIFDIQPLRLALLGVAEGGGAGIPQMSPMEFQRMKFREYLRGKDNPLQSQANTARGLLRPLVALANGIDKDDAWTAQRLAKSRVSGGENDMCEMILAGLRIMEMVDGIADPNGKPLLDVSAVPGLFDLPPKKEGGAAKRAPLPDDAEDYNASFGGEFS